MFTMPERILVTGGGITGTFAAETLANDNYDVTLVEQHTSLIDGTSAWTMSLHTGPEYSGDPNTAVECLKSAGKFKRYAPEVTGANKVHYVVASDSQISMEKYLAFMRDLTESYADLPAEYHVFGSPEDFYKIHDANRYPAMKKGSVVGGVETQDATFNMNAIRKRAVRLFGSLGVQTMFGTRVEEITQQGDRYRVEYTRDGETQTAEFDQVVNTGGYRAVLLDRNFGEVPPYSYNVKTFHIVEDEGDPDSEIPSLAVVRGNYFTHYKYAGNKYSVLNAAGSPEGSKIQYLQIDPENPQLPEDIDEMMRVRQMPNAASRVEKTRQFIGDTFMDTSRFRTVALVPGIAVSYRHDEHARNQAEPQELVPGYHTAVATKSTHAVHLANGILQNVVARSVANGFREPGEH